MAVNFLSLVKDIIDSRDSINPQNPKYTFPFDKEKWNWHVTLRDSIKARRRCIDVLKKLKGNKCQPKILDLMKTTFKDKMKTFLDEWKF